MYLDFSKMIGLQILKLNLLHSEITDERKEFPKNYF